MEEELRKFRRNQLQQRQLLEKNLLVEVHVLFWALIFRVLSLSLHPGLEKVNLSKSFDASLSLAFQGGGGLNCVASIDRF